MSTNQIIFESQSPHKIITGDGDGFNFHKNSKMSPKMRAAVPSSRKFGTKSPTTNMKQKLELALMEMGSDYCKNVSFKKKSPKLKANSISELTPSKNTPKTQITSSGSECGELNANKAPKKPLDKPTKKAALLIYKNLLLNAWRMNRNVIKKMDRNLKDRDQEIVQYKIQINVLQTLRKTESSRREILRSQAQELKKNLDNFKTENTKLLQEKSLLENDHNILQDTINNLQNELSNSRSAFLKIQKESLIYEQKFLSTNEKLKKDVEEKRILMEKQCQLQNLLSAQKESITNMKMSMANAENSVRSLQLELLTARNDNNKLTEELQEEIAIRKDQENQMEALILQNEDKDFQIDELNCKFETLNKCFEELETQNNDTRECLMNLSHKFLEETNKNWWKNAKTMAVATYKILEYGAHIMLPALPPKDIPNVSRL